MSEQKRIPHPNPKFEDFYLRLEKMRERLKSMTEGIYPETTDKKTEPKKDPEDDSETI